MKKFFIWFGIIVLVLIGLRFAIGPKKAKKEITLSNPVVKTSVLSKTDYSITMDYFGNVKGIHDAYALSQVPGRFVKYLVKEGDFVRKDQPIAEIDRDVVGMEFKPAVVKSPVSGTVGNLSFAKGDMVTPQKPVATVANLSRVRVIVSVPDKDIEHFKKGMEAIITSDVIPGKKWIGYVNRVPSVVNPMTSTGLLEIVVKNPDKSLRSGFVVNVNIEIEKLHSVFVVNDEVVRKTNEGDFVFVKRGNKAKRIQIDIVYSGKGKAVISGVTEGDTLITNGMEILRDGEEVTEVGGRS